MSPVLDAAVGYAGRGLRVHPLRPGSKLPLLESWQTRATTDAATVAAWWTRWPAAGIGIATGSASGVIVVDVDARHHGDEALHDLEREHGEQLPTTWRCLTAGGGVHVYLGHPGGIVRNRVGLLPGIDLRGDAGYAVGPPTTLDGARAYVWEIGAGPDDLPIAPVPTWLLERLRHRTDGEARPVDEWAALVRDGADAGARNDAVARLAGYLLRRRPAPRVVLELVRAWNASRCRPALEDDEITRTVESIARRELRRREAGR